MPKTRRSMIRKLLLSLGLISGLLLLSCSSAKNKEIFEDLEGEEGIYMLKLPPALFLKLIDTGTDAQTSGLGNIDYVKLLFFDQQKSSSITSKQLSRDIKEKFGKYGYEMAIEFSNGGTGISAYMLQKEDFVSDLMLLISEENNLVGLGLSGRLDSKSLMEFASEIDYKDLAGLSSGNISF
jgi:hypothetical protein